MNHFEYDFVQVDSPLTTPALNARGADRWQLVGFCIDTIASMKQRYCYIFMRGRLRG